MGMFTKISSDAFEALQLDAGVLLTNFDPENPYVEPTDAQIIATTSGGINPTCVPKYSDFAADIDNASDNMMEFMHLDGWDCKMAFTSIKFNAAGVKLALGAADSTTLTNGVKKVLPRRNLSQSDFSDIWWVGDKADGGAAAVRLKNALSSGGFSMQTTKNGKGTIGMEITGHVSVKAQNDMPMEFYDIPPQSGAGTVPVVQNLKNATSSFSNTSVSEGGSLSATITAASGYSLENGDIVVTMGGVDITALCTTISTTGSISISKVTSGVIITVDATKNT